MAKNNASAALPIDEIAEILGISKRGAEMRAQKQGWQFQSSDSVGRHKKRLYTVDDLPADIQTLIKTKIDLKKLAEIGVSQSADTSKTNAAPIFAIPKIARPVTIELSSLDDTQCLRDGCRQLILQYIDRFDGSEASAIAAINAAYSANELPSDLQHAILHCNDRANSERIGHLSGRTIRDWRKRQKTGTCSPQKSRQKADWTTIWWLPLLLAEYRLPQKPTLKEAHNHFKTAWEHQFKENCPSYGACYRLFKTIPEVVLKTGRSTGSEIASIKAFVRRDWTGNSNEVWVGDGHTFKAKVRHPEHGYAFAPEVTVIIDAASRFIVGWAFSLSENQIAVSEALGTGMIKHGKPLIYYSDNGAGQTAKTIDCPVGGMLARMGVRHETGIPGNPQGRGLIEGLWDITTIYVAKQMPTFQGTGMDGGTLRTVSNTINSAKKRGETPSFVPSWQDFVAQCEARFEWYNTQHKHSELGGKTPAEQYYANFDDSWSCPLTEDEKINLYRPFVIRTPIRGEVQWLNNRYFHKNLAELPEKTKVRVAYDLCNAEQVWVSDLNGRPLCIALFDGNKVAGFPVSLRDNLKEKRIDGRVKLAQEKINTAELERGNTLEGETLARIPVITKTTAEPLKRVAVERTINAEGEDDQAGSYADTVQRLKKLRKDD